MRALLLALPLSILTLFPSSGDAGDARPREIAVSDSGKDQSANPKGGTYHGYFLDLSEIAGQQNYTSIANSLQHQLDIVDGVGLSPRVLKFFHSVPVVIDEFGCLEGYTAAADDKKPTDKKLTLAAACYNPTGRPQRLQDKQRDVSVWVDEKSEWTNSDPLAQAVDTHRGVVLVRPIMLGVSSRQAQEPLILHELLHAYHAKIMPQGVKNPAVLFHYNFAKDEKLYPDDAYLMTNEREFFGVTASVFLYGKDGKEPFTRSKIYEKQPDYYQYLVWLFGFDPGAPSATPFASAD
jgi:hypothetical protein